MMKERVDLLSFSKTKKIIPDSLDWSKGTANFFFAFLFLFVILIFFLAFYLAFFFFIILFAAFSGVAQQFFGRCDATDYIQQKINNENSHKTVKSRLTFISAFSIIVTVILMKTAVAKNLSQSIRSALNIKTFPKVFDNPVNIPFLEGCPGIPWLPLRDATGCILLFAFSYFIFFLVTFFFFFVTVFCFFR